MVSVVKYIVSYIRIVRYYSTFCNCVPEQHVLSSVLYHGVIPMRHICEIHSK